MPVRTVRSQPMTGDEAFDPTGRPGGRPPAHRPRRVVPADVRPLSQALARAFEDDPVSLYLLPGERVHLHRLERYFDWQLLHVFLPRGEAWTTDDLAGASLWVGPDRSPPSVVEGLVQLFAAVRILRRQTGRALRLLELLEAEHPKIRHCYLATIGTDPDRQGHGVGSALLSVVLDRLDREGVPAYLESSKEENLSFYRRHGFEVTGEVVAPEGGPRLWLMWREPLPPGERAR